MGIRLKLTLPITLLCGVLFLYFNYYWLPSFTEKALNTFQTQLNEQLHTLIQSLSDEIIRGDLANVYATLDEVMERNKDWLQLSLYDGENQLVYPFELNNPPDSNPHILLASAQNSNVTAGAKIELITEPRQFYAEQDRLILEMRLLLISALGIVIAVTIIMSNFLVRRPISQLANAANDLVEQKYSTLLTYRANDEVGELVQAFNKMRAGLAKYQHELQQSRDNAIRLSQVKSQFLANMSHELRTPLNAILGYNSLLQEALVTNESMALEDFEHIDAAGHHLLELISDILDISKVESGSLKLNLSDFDLGELIRDVVDNTRYAAEKNNNQIDHRVGQGLHNIHGDRTRVAQVLTNLVKNACNFTHNGSVSISAESIKIQDKDYFCVDVSDTGIGIAAEDQMSLFEVFTQVDDSYRRKQGGTGLGLSICRQMCELMQGDIFVQSQPNKGSTFTFQLPMDLSVKKEQGSSD